MLKRAMSWCSGLLIAATLVTAPSSAAQADPPALPGNWTYVQNAKSGQYLSLAGGKGDNGSHAIQWAFNGNLDQQWELVATGVSGYRYLRNATSWRRLGIVGGNLANGAHAVIWNENSNNDQRWLFRASGPGFQLINERSGKCLGVSGASPTQGAHVVQWTCNGSSDQVWIMG